jgi:hypothetical protein
LGSVTSVENENFVAQIKSKKKDKEKVRKKV